MSSSGNLTKPREMQLILLGYVIIEICEIFTVGRVVHKWVLTFAASFSRCGLAMSKCIVRAYRGYAANTCLPGPGYLIQPRLDRVVGPKPANPALPLLNLLLPPPSLRLIPSCPNCPNTHRPPPCINLRVIKEKMHSRELSAIRPSQVTIRSFRHRFTRAELRYGRFPTRPR